MNSYFLDALAPLVFRSGKPFGAQSDTDDIQFPLPSAAAGLVRTQIMGQSGCNWDSKPKAIEPSCRTHKSMNYAKLPYRARF